MAEYTYQTRNKMTEDWLNSVRAKSAGLSSMEKQLLPGKAYYSVSQKACEWMTDLLDMGTCRTLSEIYKSQLSGIVKACIPAGMEEEFYYALDEMNKYQMTGGWLRRSVRSGSYKPFARASVLL